MDAKYIFQPNKLIDAAITAPQPERMRKMNEESVWDEKFLTGKRVLVVDEDQGLVDSNVDLMRIWDASEVDTALDATTALEKMKTEPFYDLVVLEIVLPLKPELAEKMERCKNALSDLSRQRNALVESPDFEHDEANQKFQEAKRLERKISFVGQTADDSLYFRAGLEALMDLSSYLKAKFGDDFASKLPILVLTSQDSYLDVAYLLKSTGLNYRLLGKGANMVAIAANIKRLLSLA